MNKTVAYIVTIVILLGTIILGVHVLWPKVVTVDHTIPIIVTKRETVSVSPQWLSDSIRYWKSRPTITDTVNLTKTILVTVHDTIAQESLVWPILTISIKDSSALVRTYNSTLKKDAVSTIYAPGPLVFAAADTTSTPRLDFGPRQAPVSPSPSLFYGLKKEATGAIVALAFVELFRLIRGN